jgi:hypothetical protein
MSLIIPPSQQTTAEQRADVLDQLAKRRDGVNEQLRAASFWARMKADPDFESVLPKGLLGDLYTEVDSLIDTCELIDLPNLRAQRKMVRRLRDRIETEMNSGTEKLESLRAELALIQQETDTVLAAKPEQYE